MTVDEIYDKIYANNKHQKERDNQLVLTEGKIRRIREALSQLTARPRLAELLEFLRQIREVLK